MHWKERYRIATLLLAYNISIQESTAFIPLGNPLSFNDVIGKPLPFNDVIGKPLRSVSVDESLIINKDESDKINGVNSAFGTDERYLRFGGVGRLYANNGDPTSDLPAHVEIVERLTSSTVAVVGLGGVGSWAAEALCRSGVGNLLLVDLDDICISNTNRQLHALSSTIGKMKLDEMKHRLSDINPQCNITLIHDFVSAQNVYDILDSAQNGLTALLDAMDGMEEKSALLAACVHRRIPVVTCGAAAGRMDPTKIIVQDLTKVSDDRLLATCRKNLRKFYGFERGLSFGDIHKKKQKLSKWNIKAVTSTEIIRQVCQGNDVSSFRRCDGPLGTACFVVGSYGFAAASCIVDMIANNNLLKPRLQGKQPHDNTSGAREDTLFTQDNLMM